MPRATAWAEAQMLLGESDCEDETGPLEGPTLPLSSGRAAMRRALVCEPSDGNMSVSRTGVYEHSIQGAGRTTTTSFRTAVSLQ